MTKPREPSPTVAFVDDSCAHYRAVFPNVRQCEQFTHLELGLVAGSRDQTPVAAAPRPGDEGRSPGLPPLPGQSRLVGGGAAGGAPGADAAGAAGAPVHFVS